MGGYYSEQKGVPQLIEEVKGYVDKGFDTVKLKIGGLSVKEDIERIKAVRESFGEKLDIAVDANNVYDFNTALAVLKWGQRFRKCLFCLTGTGIVPPDDFSLQEGDVVEIEIKNRCS